MRWTWLALGLSLANVVFYTCQAVIYGGWSAMIAVIWAVISVIYFIILDQNGAFNGR